MRDSYSIRKKKSFSFVLYGSGTYAYIVYRTLSVSLHITRIQLEHTVVRQKEEKKNRFAAYTHTIQECLHVCR